MAIDQHIPLHRFSTEEYEAIISSGALEDRRVELLDGLLVDLMPQDEPHWRVIKFLMVLCAPRIDLLRVQAPLSVAEGWMPEPDVALVDEDPDRHVRPTTAHLAVEVAASNRYRDLRKAGVYARAGVARYWIVDLERGSVLEHSDPAEDGYSLVARRTGEDELDTGVDTIPATTVAALLGR